MRFFRITTLGFAVKKSVSGKQLQKKILREAAKKKVFYSGPATKKKKNSRKNNFPKNVATKLEGGGERPQWPGH